MTDAFKSIEQGLKEALSHARGEALGVVHEIDLPEPDVQAIRARTGLSQIVDFHPEVSRLGA